MKITSGRARTIRDLLDRVASGDRGPVIESQAKEAIAYLKPRPKMRKVLPFASRKEEKLLKRKTHALSTLQIRVACLNRAGGLCECGCGRLLGLFGFELDHWLGGSGRRRQKQSVENCWMLRQLCHFARTTASPSAAHWNTLFEKHCAKYGYPFTPHLEHQPAERRIP